ncbi:MAG TPA: GntR family transcriptional regulator [Roseiarcus sp.]|jgi:GntR family transcriptional regulator|nr:GntR family transcriptional regulator [Roseiarcus sp.]
MLDIALTEPMFRLARLRLVNGVPMAIERAAVPLRFFERAEPDRDSLYPALETADFPRVRPHGLMLGAAETALPGIAEGAPALDIHRVAYAADGPQVEFARSTYRSDTNNFVAELTVSPSARSRIEGAAR